jgi:hypothetical protein
MAADTFPSEHKQEGVLGVLLENDMASFPIYDYMRMEHKLTAVHATIRAMPRPVTFMPSACQQETDFRV